MSKKNRTARTASVSSLSAIETVTAVLELPTETVSSSVPSISDVEFSEILSSPLPETVGDAIRSLPDSAFFPVPTVSAPAPRFVTVGARDSFGFGSDSEVSFLIREIRTGAYTRKSLLSAFLSKFVPTGDEAETKRKKTSFSVFFSDVKRPFGTYYASRSLPILSDESGILSFDPSRIAVVEKAVSDGILPALKGLSASRTPDRYRAALEKYGVYFPSEK